MGVSGTAGISSSVVALGGIKSSLPRLRGSMMSYETELYGFLNRMTKYRVYQIRYQAVTDYSDDRHVSIPADKLPALAGVASRVQAITSGTYVAGHWHRELERSLFYSVHTSSCQPEHVKEYRAPTWNWVSVNGCTRWEFRGTTSSLKLQAL